MAAVLCGAGNHTSFSDAMFTATTCVCVTGLVTVVTASHWSMAGRVIILLLIQIGGVGLISLGSYYFYKSSGKNIINETPYYTRVL